MMRYSPRPMGDYRTERSGDSPANYIDNEAQWNLIWLSYPEVDRFLGLKKGNGNFIPKSSACGNVLRKHPDLVEAMELGPAHFVHYVKNHPKLKSMALYRRHGEAWLRTMSARASRHDGGPPQTTATGNVVYASFPGRPR